MTFADQSDWPKERVGGWAPGMYFCRCKECRAEYMGDKRSWLCYPCTKNAGPTPDYTGEGSAWVPPTPVTDAALVEVRSWIHAVGPVGAMVWVDPQEVLKAAGVRALGEGMVEELRLLRELEKRTRAIKDNPTIREKIILDKLDTLRANQGGVNE